MNKKALKLLYRFFDLKLSQKEQNFLDKALASSKDLREEKNRIESMRKAFPDSAKGNFSPYFTAKVMQRIREIKNKNTQVNFFNTLVYDFKIIAVAAAIVLGLLVVFNFVNPFSSSDKYSVDVITIDQLVEPIAMLEMEDVL